VSSGVWLPTALSTLVVKFHIVKQKILPVRISELTILR